MYSLLGSIKYEITNAYCYNTIGELIFSLPVDDELLDKLFAITRK